MTIDTTVNLGNLLTAALAMIAFAVAFTRMGGRIDLLARDITSQNLKIDGHGDKLRDLYTVLKDQAVMQERLNAMDKRIDELRHGQGFVQGPRGIDREYPT